MIQDATSHMLYCKMTKTFTPRFIFILSAFLAASFLLGVQSSSYAQAQLSSDPAFNAWLQKFWPVARKRGIKRRTFNRAFRGVTPNPEIWRLANRQPEFVTPTMDYVIRRVNDRRIETGREKLKIHEKLLDRLEKRYGVDRYVIIAIWGLESNFGSHKGDRSVIRSLATLAYKGKRRRFGRNQLIAALKILQRGDVTPNNMMGSWAGAMGHTQFIPTTYNAYAVDLNKDGKRDIWFDVGDALGSTANYLRVSKWRKGHAWGYEVKRTRRLPRVVLKSKKYRTLAAWRKLGVVRVNDQRYPRPNDRAKLYLPAGADGPAFLLLSNFRSILRYNNAYAYALSVGHLADRLKGLPAFQTASLSSSVTAATKKASTGQASTGRKTSKIVLPVPKPRRVAYKPAQNLPLNTISERKELQTLLARRGYDIGKIDGVIGVRTSKAVLFYQSLKGFDTDGVPTRALLAALRNDLNKASY